MRTAVLILVLVLVVAISTEVDGFWGRRRSARLRRVRRSRRRSQQRCTSCRTCRRRRIGKRNVELDEEIYPEYDSRLLSDEKFYDKWQPLKAAVSKSREKRALKKLKYPGDCKSSKLQNFAKKCGLTVVPGGSHIKVCDGNRQITVIPHSVKSNYTCNNIINILNGRCI